MSGNNLPPCCELFSLLIAFSAVQRYFQIPWIITCWILEQVPMLLEFCSENSFLNLSIEVYSFNFHWAFSAFELNIKFWLKRKTNSLIQCINIYVIYLYIYIYHICISEITTVIQKMIVSITSKFPCFMHCL